MLDRVDEGALLRVEVDGKQICGLDDGLMLAANRGVICRETSAINGLATKGLPAP